VSIAICHPLGDSPDAVYVAKALQKYYAVQ